MDAADGRISRRLLLRLGWFSLLSAGVLSLWPLTEYLTSQADSTQSAMITIQDPSMIGKIWFHVPASRVWVKKDATGYTALVATCTHLGCEVTFKPAEKKWLCPCHGSAYDEEGRPAAGPAPKALQRVAIHKEANGALIINTAQNLAMDARTL